MAPGPILTWPAQALAPLCIPYSRVLLLENDAPPLSTMLYFIALALFLCSSWITAVIHVFCVPVLLAPGGIFGIMVCFHAHAPSLFSCIGWEHPLLSHVYTSYLVHLQFLYLCKPSL